MQHGMGLPARVADTRTDRQGGTKIQPLRAGWPWSREWAWSLPFPRLAGDGRHVHAARRESSNGRSQGFKLHSTCSPRPVSCRILPMRSMATTTRVSPPARRTSELMPSQAHLSTDGAGDADVAVDVGQGHADPPELQLLVGGVHPRDPSLPRRHPTELPS